MGAQSEEAGHQAVKHAAVDGSAATVAMSPGPDALVD
jgi:hypothetical protein